MAVLKKRQKPERTTAERLQHTVRFALELHGMPFAHDASLFVAA
jgi:hypothetical protein